MVEALTTIWQRVLQRASIGVNDHFFSIGGGFDAADMLFAAIAHPRTTQAPPSTMLQPSHSWLVFWTSPRCRDSRPSSR
jgi:hypothetical protein